MKYLLYLPVVLFFSCNQFNQSANLKKAAAAEVTGKYDLALALYGDALLQVTPSIDVPNVYRSKILEASDWKKMLEKYTVFISTKPEALSKDFQVILDGIQRCSTHVNPDNYLTTIRDTACTGDKYRSEWFKAFFSPNIAVDSTQISLISGNFLRNTSFIRISSRKSYTYDLYLINKSTGTRQNATLYPEDRALLMAVPGEYVLVCIGSVKFPSGALWKSNYTLFTIIVPEKVSLISTQVYTKVSREK